MRNNYNIWKYSWRWQIRVLHRYIVTHELRIALVLTHATSLRSACLHAVLECRTHSCGGNESLFGFKAALSASSDT